jgi:phage repressor protein C with HTH and peptisase S24 domain
VLSADFGDGNMRHEDVWRGLDQLAEKHGLTVSGLARLAGLDATAFNKSKRRSKDNRPRWPSTESISRALDAVGDDFEDFVDLTAESRGVLMPILDFQQAAQPGRFDATGRPISAAWDAVRFPGQDFDKRAFALDLNDASLAPTYRQGDRLIVSPSGEYSMGDRIVLMTRDGKLLAGELGRQTARRIELKSLSKQQSSWIFPPSELTWIARILWASQ